MAGRRRGRGEPARAVAVPAVRVGSTSWLFSTQVGDAPTGSVAAGSRGRPANAAADQSAQQPEEVERLMRARPGGRTPPSDGVRDPSLGDAIRSRGSRRGSRPSAGRRRGSRAGRHRLVVARRVDHVRGAAAAGSCRSGRPSALTRPLATSIRKPSTPRSSQNAARPRTSRHFGVAPVEVGLAGVEQVEVPLPVVGHGSRRVRRRPTASCSAGCRRPRRPGRCSGPARSCRAGRQGLPEPGVLGGRWLGTMSTMTRNRGVARSAAGRSLPGSRTAGRRRSSR